MNEKQRRDQAAATAARALRSLGLQHPQQGPTRTVATRTWEHVSMEAIEDQTGGIHLVVESQTVGVVSPGTDCEPILDTFVRVLDVVAGTLDHGEEG